MLSTGQREFTSVALFFVAVNSVQPLQSLQPLAVHGGVRIEDADMLPSVCSMVIVTHP